MVPPALLEGSLTGASTPPFVSGCPAIDAPINALHTLARTGQIPHDVADRQLNTFLLAAGAGKACQHRARLVMSIADAPHYTLLPDLGRVLHHILCRDPLPCSLTAVIDQAMPVLTSQSRLPDYQDSQPVLLVLVLAFVLGLFPGPTVKRPSFATRAQLYRAVHLVLTRPPEEQTAFCLSNHSVIALSAMEYVTRILPLYMPCQFRFLQEREECNPVYFRRVPPMCDEFRQSIDDLPRIEWAGMQATCAGLLERVTRLRKACVKPGLRQEVGAQRLLLSCGNIAQYWTAPRLQLCSSVDEFRLLGHFLRLQGPVLQHLQRSVILTSLPQNLRRLQEAALARLSRGGLQSTFLRSRHYLCSQCALTNRQGRQLKIRLDTLQQELVCSVCDGRDVLSVDMIGRILRHHSQSFVLCPVCVRVHQFTEADASMWFSSQCGHQEPRRASQSRDKQPCAVCSDPVASGGIERVDATTGEMRRFVFCHRHLPRHDVLVECTNARQLQARCA